MSAIVANLNALSDKRNQIQKIDRTIEGLAGELFQQRRALELECKVLENKIKQQANCIPFDKRHTLVGESLQLVYEERRHIDLEALIDVCTQYGVSEADYRRIVQIKPGWSIRRVGRGS